MKNFLLTIWYFPLRLWHNYKSWRFEQKCLKHFGMRPQKMYVSQEAYDKLVEIINKPPDPEQSEKLKKFLSMKSPWDEGE